MENLPPIITKRQKVSHGLLLFRLNVNSLQNKFEEVKSVIKHNLRAQVTLLSETKIDASYPNSQFKIEGYNMYRIPESTTLCLMLVKIKSIKVLEFTVMCVGELISSLRSYKSVIPLRFLLSELAFVSFEFKKSI